MSKSFDVAVGHASLCQACVPTLYLTCFSMTMLQLGCMWIDQDYCTKIMSYIPICIRYSGLWSMIFLLNFVFSWYVLELWWQLGFPLKTSWSYEPTRPWPTRLTISVMIFVWGHSLLWSFRSCQVWSYLSVWSWSSSVSLRLTSVPVGKSLLLQYVKWLVTSHNIYVPRLDSFQYPFLEQCSTKNFSEAACKCI